MSRNRFEILDNAREIDELSWKVRQFLFNNDKHIHKNLEKKISKLKNIKIVDFVAKTVPSVDGFVNYDETDGYATIYLSDGLSQEDRNFTLVHEFAHLIFDFKWSFSEGKPRVNCGLLIHSRTDIIASNSYSERRVNEFAASFLIPYNLESQDHIKNKDINDLIEQYGVSSLVIERRKLMFEQNPIEEEGK